ncbi:MAG: ferrous iron transporter B, partial [Clostridia bacterium]|nr:ferrous iron transporter B [Clostridia bacterium]
IATVVVWFLQSFDFRFNLVSDPKNSMLATVAGLLAPLMRPVGLGDWRLITSLVCGFMAKESVVASMEVLFSAGELHAAVSGLTAAAMLAFTLLYTPCVAAVGSIRRELGWRWSAGVVLWQCAIAWAAALIVHLIGMAFGRA